MPPFCKGALAVSSAERGWARPPCEQGEAGGGISFADMAFFSAQALINGDSDYLCRYFHYRIQSSLLIPNEEMSNAK